MVFPWGGNHFKCKKQLFWGKHFKGRQQNEKTCRPTTWWWLMHPVEKHAACLSKWIIFAICGVKKNHYINDWNTPRDKTCPMWLGQVNLIDFPFREKHMSDTPPTSNFWSPHHQKYCLKKLLFTWQSFKNIIKGHEALGKSIQKTWRFCFHGLGNLSYLYTPAKMQPSNMAIWRRIPWSDPSEEISDVARICLDLVKNFPHTHTRISSHCHHAIHVWSIDIPKLDSQQKLKCKQYNSSIG